MVYKTNISIMPKSVSVKNKNCQKVVKFYLLMDFFCILCCKIKAYKLKIVFNSFFEKIQCVLYENLARHVGWCVATNKPLVSR